MKIKGTSRTIFFILTGIMLIYFLPIVFSFKLESAIQPFNNKLEDLNPVLIRTVLLSFLATLFIIISSFSISICLFSIPFFSAFGRHLSNLMLPVLLGNISIAFIFRISLSNTTFLNHLLNDNKTQLYIFWCFLQFWQYGILFIYLFWISFQNIPKALLDYSKATKLSFVIVLKDIIIPATKNQIILFSIICFVFTFYENAKSSLIFFFSRGTDTELLAGWFQRMFQQKTSVVSADIAAKSFYSSGLIITFIASFILMLIAILTGYILKLLSKKSRGTDNMLRFSFHTPNKKLGQIVSIFLIALTFFPIFLPYINLKVGQLKEFTNLFNSLLYTIVAAFFSTVLSLLFSISARIGWRHSLKDFNNKSLIFFSITFGFLVIPPICIYIVSFYWLGLTGYSNFSILLSLWVFIHSILLLPLLGSFLVTIHFRVKTKELEYLDAYKMKWKEFFGISFIRRFLLEYFLTFIFAFSFIWNDYGFNSVMSDRVESFATVLKMSFSGRSANQNLGFLYYSISLFIALCCVGLWKLILKKSQRIAQ